MRANLCDSPSVSNGSVFGGPAQVNFEIHKAAILFDGHYFGYVEMSGIDEFELASQVEKEKPLHRAMWRDDARLHPCFPYGLLHFRPFLVPSGLRAAQGDGQPFAGYVLGGRMGDHVGCPFRRKRVQRLMIFFGEREVQSNTLQVDLHTVIRIISKNDLDGDDSCRKWRLLWKLLLIVCRVGPRPRRDGHSLVGFQRCALERRRLLGGSLLGSRQGGGKKGKDES